MHIWLKLRMILLKLINQLTIYSWFARNHFRLLFVLIRQWHCVQMSFSQVHLCLVMMFFKNTSFSWDCLLVAIFTWDMLTQTLFFISLLWFYSLAKTNQTCLPVQVWYTNMNSFPSHWQQGDLDCHLPRSEDLQHVMGWCFSSACGMLVRCQMFVLNTLVYCAICLIASVSITFHFLTIGKLACSVCVRACAHPVCARARMF